MGGLVPTAVLALASVASSARGEPAGTHQAVAAAVRQAQSRAETAKGAEPAPPLQKPTSPPSRKGPRPARTHLVEEGETLFRIGFTYGVSVEELLLANGMTDPSRLRAGQILLIPRSYGRPVPETARQLPPAGPPPAHAPATRPPATQAARHEPEESADEEVTGEPGSMAAAIDEELPAPDEAHVGISYTLIPTDEPFSSPIPGGTVYSPFGRRHGRLHAGIDITAPLGSPVFASRDGSVLYSGRKFQGYGNVVLIDHGDGFITLYAHNSKNLVRKGERVVRGQTIALVGSTGNATGTHCHFEIRRANTAIDPLRYVASHNDDVLIARGGPARQPLRRTNQAGIAATPDPTP